MKVDRAKLDMVLARQCKSVKDLEAHFAPVTIYRMRNDPSYTPSTKTIGRLAAALGVDPKTLVQEDT